MDRTRAVIGADAKFAGTISNVRSIEIEGTVEADLTAEKLSIGATGKFTGQVSCDLVVIGGAYDGIMQAGSIWATETAQIAGEIHYRSLQMDRGAAPAAVLCITGRACGTPVVEEEPAEESEAGASDKK